MSDSKRSRRHFTTEQKVALLKHHLVDKVPQDREHGARELLGRASAGELAEVAAALGDLH